MWENDDDLAISPDGRTILFWRKGSTEQTNKINMVSPDGKLFRTVVKDGYNTGAVWSPDSQKFAFNRKSASATQNQTPRCDPSPPRGAAPPSHTHPAPFPTLFLTFLSNLIIILFHKL
jgi:Tol biopolymer transport system component